MAGVQLSPLNFSGLLCNLREPEHDKLARRYEAVTMYRCLTCDETHDWGSDARLCCPPGSDEEDPKCPVCAAEFTEHRDAADCCLWKDLDAPTRHRIADAVEAGSTWAAELKVNEFGRLG